MAEPVGEDGWLAFLDEASRTATNIESRIGVVEQYKVCDVSPRDSVTPLLNLQTNRRNHITNANLYALQSKAIASEPWSLKLWLAYCEWFWSLHTDCQTADAGWPEDEQLFGQEVFTLSESLLIWEEGYRSTQYRINDSHEIWNRWISIELEELSKARTKEYIERVRNIFFQRVQIPHGTWDETAQKLSTFLSDYDTASYESTMITVTRLSARPRELYALREPFELKLQQAIDSGDIEAQRVALKDYIDWECLQARMKDKKGKLKNPESQVLCGALFERALCSAALGMDSELWQDYIAWLRQNSQSSEADVMSILQRATSHCPWSGALWADYITTAEAKRCPHRDIEMIKHSATNAHLDRDGMASVVEVYIAWCGYLSRRATTPGAPEEDVDLADMGLPTALEDVRTWGKRLDGPEYKGDPLFRIERIMIRYSSQKGLLDEARGYWRNLVANHADSYEFWQQYYFWEMTMQRPNEFPAIANDVLIQCVTRHLTLDWPEKMLEVYVRHAQTYCDAASLIIALNTVRFATKAVALRRQKENAAAAAAYAQQQPSSDAPVAEGSPSAATKRKREATPGEGDANTNKKLKSIEQDAGSTHVLRDRENTSVFVTNLPKAIEKPKLRQYFKDYGDINTITLRSDDQSSSALIEFRSNEDVQSALLRDGKYLNTNEIHVVAATGFTLYVTNYPPSADEAFFHDLFKDCGAIFSIRFPSLRFNAHRRFCYITFRSGSAAAAATQLHGTTLDGGFKLVAMYSDPSNKKAREGAVEEGRELHLTGLDRSLHEDDLREAFGKYGIVERVNLLKTMAGVSKGAAFVVFKNKEDASSALDLDKTKFKSRVITVELSTPKNFKKDATSKGISASPAPDADGDSVVSQSPAPDGQTESRNSHGPSKEELTNRTVTLMNIPDTINDARIRVLAEAYGPISKLVLRPDHQGAIIEFADAASAGKASLGLENHEIAPGRKLHTGGMKDLLKEKGEIKTDKILVGKENKPMSGFIQPNAHIRRPGPPAKAGGKGGLGSKKGLGYSGPKPTSGPDSGELNGNRTGEESGATKSNADFKAMFLSGGTQ